MPSGKGMIVLMGSGELTATMVEVHKELLRRLSAEPKAVFLDTPAGFQLNVDQISEKARDYFRSHVQQTLKIASLHLSDDFRQLFSPAQKVDFLTLCVNSGVPRALADADEVTGGS